MEDFFKEKLPNICSYVWILGSESGLGSEQLRLLVKIVLSHSDGKVIVF